jgi:hypothetical protein
MVRKVSHPELFYAGAPKATGGLLKNHVKQFALDLDAKMRPQLRDRLCWHRFVLGKTFLFQFVPGRPLLRTLCGLVWFCRADLLLLQFGELAWFVLLCFVLLCFLLCSVFVLICCQFLSREQNKAWHTKANKIAQTSSPSWGRAVFVFFFEGGKTGTRLKPVDNTSLQILCFQSGDFVPRVFLDGWTDRCRGWRRSGVL